MLTTCVTNRFSPRPVPLFFSFMFTIGSHSMTHLLMSLLYYHTSSSHCSKFFFLIIEFLQIFVNLLVSRVISLSWACSLYITTVTLYIFITTVFVFHLSIFRSYSVILPFPAYHRFHSSLCSLRSRHFSMQFTLSFRFYHFFVLIFYVTVNIEWKISVFFNICLIYIVNLLQVANLYLNIPILRDSLPDNFSQ